MTTRSRSGRDNAGKLVAELIAAVAAPFVGLCLLLVLAHVERIMLGEKDLPHPSDAAEPDDGYSDSRPADDAAA